MPRIVAIDFDEVLAESMRSLLAYHDDTCCGLPLQYDDIENYHIQEMSGFEDKSRDIGQRFYDHMDLRHDMIEPVIGAQQAVEGLRSTGARLTVVTARPETLRQTTQAWLEQYFPGLFSDVIFTNHFSDKQVSKGDVCKDIAADVFVDDSLYHATEVAKYDIKTYLIDKPRNQDHHPDTHPGITKVMSWEEMYI